MINTAMKFTSGWLGSPSTVSSGSNGGRAGPKAPHHSRAGYGVKIPRSLETGLPRTAATHLVRGAAEKVGGKKILIRHVGNMGDMVFFIPPVLETLKKKYPDSHITLVTAWGFKSRRRRIRNWKLEKADVWGWRNQGGFCIHLMLTNPHVDQLIHWHDTKLSLGGSICQENGYHIPTWSAAYYESQKQSGHYNEVHELDFGLRHSDNPIERMYQALGMPDERFSHYKLYFSAPDRAVADQIMSQFPHPRIVLLESLEGTTTRGWDPPKAKKLEKEISRIYGVNPIWFGAHHARYYQGRPVSLRENIASLALCDVGIGVISGPLHFAAAAGLPTITLFGDQRIERAAPAYFLNRYIDDPAKKHRTILGPTGPHIKLLKGDTTFVNLTPAEARQQNFIDWMNPGCQATKNCLAVISVDEVLSVLKDIVAP